MCSAGLLLSKMTTSHYSLCEDSVAERPPSVIHGGRSALGTVPKLAANSQGLSCFPLRPVLPGLSLTSTREPGPKSLPTSARMGERLSLTSRLEFQPRPQ